MINPKLFDAIEHVLFVMMDHAKRVPQLPAHARTKPRCSECGLHIRGPNHAEGQDHMRRKSSRTGKAA